MPVTEKRHPWDVLERLADEVFERSIQSHLRPEDNGKFLAIDVESGSYEIDENDHMAISRLLVRCPEAEVWLRRTDRTSAYRFGRNR